MKFAKTKLAAAVAAAALASSANAAVVVGGDNGWTVSFDGNVNAFYTHTNTDSSTTNAAGVSTAGVGEDASRVHSGFLPAFFSFNVKSPTVNGLTGSGRFSFAPTIHRGKNKNDLYGTATSGLTGSGLQGASIDTREVLANVDGSFGTISFGRTLSIFGRQAILHDMVLFGVGGTYAGADFGAVSHGRIGYGYAYPDFEARFSYKTPNMNGFTAEVGAYDPSEFGGLSGAVGGTFETPIPRFEGELSYATTFTGGDFLAWVDGQYQPVDDNTTGFGAAGTTLASRDVDVAGVGFGAQIGYMGFALTGFYQTGEAISTGLQFGNLTGAGTTAAGGILNGGFNCATAGAGATAVNNCDGADNDSWYVQGTYTFNGKTKVGISYGESNQDGETFTDTAGANRTVLFNDVSNEMWSVGVYHDMTSWLKLIAEYNNMESTAENPLPGNLAETENEADTFSVGAFLTW